MTTPLSIGKLYHRIRCVVTAETHNSGFKLIDVKARTIENEKEWDSLGLHDVVEITHKGCKIVGIDSTKIDSEFEIATFMNGLRLVWNMESIKFERTGD